MDFNVLQGKLNKAKKKKGAGILCEGCEFWGAKEIIEEPKEDIDILIISGKYDGVTRIKEEDRYFELPKKCPRGFDECHYRYKIRFIMKWSQRDFCV